MLTLAVSGENHPTSLTCMCALVLPFALPAEVVDGLWADLAEAQFDSVEMSAAVLCQQAHPVRDTQVTHTVSDTHTQPRRSQECYKHFEMSDLI